MSWEDRYIESISPAATYDAEAEERRRKENESTWDKIKDTAGDIVSSIGNSDIAQALGRGYLQQQQIGKTTNENTAQGIQQGIDYLYDNGILQSPDNNPMYADFQKMPAHNDAIDNGIVAGLETADRYLPDITNDTNSYASSIARGVKSGMSNVFGGLADMGGFQKAGNYFNEAAENSAAQRPDYQWLEHPLDYLVNPQGALYDVSSGLGSSLAIAPAAALVPEGVAAGGAGLLSRFLGGLGTKAANAGLNRIGSSVSNWATSQAGKNALQSYVAGSLGTAPVEALSEGGAVLRDAQEQGLDDPRGRAWAATMENMPLLLGSNGLEMGLLRGKLFNNPSAPYAGIVERILGTPGSRATTNLGSRIAPAIGAGMAQNAGEEFYQQAIQNANTNKDYSFNPFNAPLDQYEAAAAGAIGGGGIAAPGAVISGMRKNTSLSSGNSQIDDYISNASATFGVPTNLMHAVANAESAYDTNAVSDAGAQGIMQLMPDTAAGLGVDDPFDPQQNINGGARLLRELFDKYGNWRDALIAYNEGPGNFDAGERFSGAVEYADNVLSKAGSDLSTSQAHTYNLDVQPGIREQLDGLTPTFRNALPYIGGILDEMGLAKGAAISSAYRTPEHNAAVGGAQNSYHTHGDAVDIVLPEGTTAEQAEAVRQRFESSGAFSEVLFHDAGSGYHLHLGGYNGRLQGSQSMSNDFNIDFGNENDSIDFANQLLNSDDGENRDFFKDKTIKDGQGHTVFNATDKNLAELNKQYGDMIKAYSHSMQNQRAQQYAQQQADRQARINERISARNAKAAPSGTGKLTADEIKTVGTPNLDKLRKAVANVAQTSSDPVQINELTNLFKNGDYNGEFNNNDAAVKFIMDKYPNIYRSAVNAPQPNSVRGTEGEVQQRQPQGNATVQPGGKIAASAAQSSIAQPSADDYYLRALQDRNTRNNIMDYDQAITNAAMMAVNAVNPAQSIRPMQTVDNTPYASTANISVPFEYVPSQKKKSAKVSNKQTKDIAAQPMPTPDISTTNTNATPVVEEKVSLQDIENEQEDVFKQEKINTLAKTISNAMSGTPNTSGMGHGTLSDEAEKAKRHKAFYDSLSEEERFAMDFLDYTFENTGKGFADVVKLLKDKREKEIVTYMGYLKPQMKQGVLPRSVAYNPKTGEYTNLAGFSMNYKWYQEITAHGNRRIGKKELDEVLRYVAIEHLTNGYVDPLYGEQVPKEQVVYFNGLEDAIDGLESIERKAKRYEEGRNISAKNRAGSKHDDKNIQQKQNEQTIEDAKQVGWLFHDKSMRELYGDDLPWFANTYFDKTEEDSNSWDEVEQEKTAEKLPEEYQPGVVAKPATTGQPKQIDTVERRAGEEPSEATVTESATTERPKKVLPAVENEKSAQYKLADGYKTESGRALIEADENEFVIKPDGSKDFGEITESISKATNGELKPGKIRLRVGNEKQGLIHAKKHESQAQKAGYNSIEDLVSDVARNFDSIYKRDNGEEKKPTYSLIQFQNKDHEKNTVLPIYFDIINDKDGYYIVLTAISKRDKSLRSQIKKETLIYSKKATDIATTTGDSAVRLPQSSDGAGATEERRPTSVKSNVSSNSSISEEDTISKKNPSVKSNGQDNNKTSENINQIETPVQGKKTAQSGAQTATAAIKDNNTSKVNTKDTEKIFGNTDDNLDELIKGLGIVPKKQEPKKLVDVFDDSDEHLAELKKQLGKELNNLSANPVFNPKLYTTLFEIGGIYVQRGINKFDAWRKTVKESLGDELGEKADPWLPAVWESIQSYPEDRKFNAGYMMLATKYAGAAYEDGMTNLDDIQKKFASKVSAEQAKQFAPLIESAYNGVKKFFESEAETNANDSTTGMAARDSQGNDQNAVGTDDEGGRSTRRNGNEGSRQTEQGVSEAGHEQRDIPVRDDSTAAGGKTSDSSVRTEKSADKSSSTGNSKLSGSITDSYDGTSGLDRGGTEIIPTPASARPVDERNLVKDIQENKGVPKERASRLKSIQHDLPKLFPEQQTDVLFAETRLLENKKTGVMFTNGTGTGKTFTGLGVIKRFVNEGKSNILIVTPSNSINNEWIKAAKAHFDIEITVLKDVKDAGQGVTITTYANMGYNNSLVNRKWDLVLLDEAHRLMSSEVGNITAPLKNLRAITYHHSGLDERVNRLNQSDTVYADIEKKIDEFRIKERSEDGLSDEERKEWNKLSKEISQRREKFLEDWKKIPDDKKPKVVFLSATPFAYVPDVDYAEGYLFNYDYSKSKYDGYNKPSAREDFFIKHFGYRMRYNKLQKPDAEVDNSIMEIEFNSWLKKEGAVSGRILTTDKDYDRGFILVDSGIGKKIDEGIEYLRKHFEDYYLLLPDVERRIKGNRTKYILEAVKAKAAVSLIKSYTKTGKKVVVFHDFKKSEAENPFRFSDNDVAYMAKMDLKAAQILRQQMAKFIKARPDIANMKLNDLKSPINTFKEAFGDNVLIFNGNIDKKTRAQAIKSFNDDNSGKNIILIQRAAGKEGISLHDTTGKHQRVLIDLGLPTRPTDAIQCEGRIYRVGVKSNAIFRYLNTGTASEKYIFSTTIAERSSTAENLGLGEDARALKESFVDAFQDDEWKKYLPGSNSEGTGGVEKDRAQRTVMSGFERAKTYYYGRQKKSSRNKSSEGVDYYPTPEPLGYKMVEWAGLKAGESALEPSAGHGAIARFFPANTKNTAIEPSSTLASDIRMNMAGSNNKIVEDYFENFNIVNKFDGIVMNPPFGTQAKTAAEHLQKAFKHLRDGGRIVALVPAGSSMEKRIDTWLNGNPAAKDKAKRDGEKEAVVRKKIILPAVTFERAGTRIMTNVYIIDKYSDEDLRNYANRYNTSRGESRTIDLSKANTVNDFFDNLEYINVPERLTDADIEEIKQMSTSNKDVSKNRTQKSSAMSAQDKEVSNILDGEPETIGSVTLRKYGSGDKSSLNVEPTNKSKKLADGFIKEIKSFFNQRAFKNDRMSSSDTGLSFDFNSSGSADVMYGKISRTAKEQGNKAVMDFTLDNKNDTKDTPSDVNMDFTPAQREIIRNMRASLEFTMKKPISASVTLEANAIMRDGFLKSDEAKKIVQNPELTATDKKEKLTDLAYDLRREKLSSPKYNDFFNIKPILDDFVRIAYIDLDKAFGEAAENTAKPASKNDVFKEHNLIITPVKELPHGYAVRINTKEENDAGKDIVKLLNKRLEQENIKFTLGNAPDSKQYLFDFEEDAQRGREAAIEIARQVLDENIPRGFAVDEYTHTKTNQKMARAIMTDYVPRERYQQYAALAKKANGKYSRYAKGFLFDNEDDRANFLKAVSGLLGDDAQYSFKDDAYKRLKNYNDVRELADFSKPEPLTEQEQQLSEIAGQLGTPIIWYNGPAGFRGWHADGITYLNRDSNWPLQKVFWHETFHWMAANNPQLVEDLSRYVNEKVPFTQAQIDAYAKSIYKGEQMDKAKLLEEMMADSMEDTAKRVGFFRTLGKKNKSLFKRLVSFVNNLIKRFTAFFAVEKNPGLTSKQSRAMADAFKKMALAMTDKQGNKIFKRGADGYISIETNKKFYSIDADEEKQLKELYGDDFMDDLFDDDDYSARFSADNEKSIDSATATNRGAFKRLKEKVTTVKMPKGVTLLTQSARDAKIKALGNIGIIEGFLNSPSRLAEKYPAFAPVFTFADNAMRKLQKNRSYFAEELKKAYDMLDSYKQDIEELNALMFKGDTESVEFGKDIKDPDKRAQAIAKEQGVKIGTARAYIHIRSLLDQAYNMINRARQQVQVKSETVSESKLDGLKSNKFITILKEEKTGADSYLVTYEEIPHWTKTYQIDAAALEKFRKDDAIQILEEREGIEEDGAARYYDNNYSTPKGEKINLDSHKMYTVYVREGIPAVNKLEGYVPHFFHDWFVVVKNADGTTTTVDSGRNVKEAVAKAEAYMKDNEGVELIIRPKRFDFSQLGVDEDGYAALVGDKQYGTINKRIADEFDMSIDEAKQLMNGKGQTVQQAFKGASHHRFFGNIQHRTGAKGYEQQDIDWVLRHYFNSACRYEALETEFKPKAISLFERLYGNFNSGKYSGTAKYMQDYINDVNGNPNSIEMWLNDRLNNNRLWRKFAVSHFGDRAALQMTSSVTNAVSIMKLGVWNISSAMLNLSQMVNTIALLTRKNPAATTALLFKSCWDIKAWTDEGARKAVERLSEDERRAIKDSGVLDDMGLDAGAGYYKPVRGNLGEKSMYFFKLAEGIMRRGTVLAAYRQAKKEGKNYNEALDYAMEINRKANFEYAVQDAPNMFRRGGIFSQILFQFQKYPIKQLELMHEFIPECVPIIGSKKGSTTWQQKASFWAAYALLGGAFSLPAEALLWSIFGLITEPLFGVNPEKGIKKTLLEMGKDADPLTRGALRAVMYGLPAAFFNVDVSQRVGMSDVIPGTGPDYNKDENPIIQGMSKWGGAVGGTAAQFYSSMTKGDTLGMVRSISPGAYNIIAAGIGQTRDSRGRVTTQYDDVYSRIIRGMGFKSADESLAADAMSIKYYEMDQGSKEKKALIDDYLDAEEAGEPKGEILKELKTMYKTSDGLKKAIKDARENRKLDRMQRAGAGNKKAPDYYKGAEALSW